MFKITIEATTDKDRENIDLLRDRLCYGITDDMDIKLRAKGWTGHSGGDDAYFLLSGKTVKVEVKR